MKKGFIASKLRVGRKTQDENTVERKSEFFTGSNFSWIDLQSPDRKEVEKIAEKYHFNSLNIEDCLTKFELPKLDSYDDHFFVILHFPPVAKIMPKYSQLSIFVGRDFLITIHQGDLKPLVDLVNICKTDTDVDRKKRLLGKSPGYLLHEIIDVLVDELLHTSRRIIANMDDIEDGVFDETRSVAKSIALLRREINTLRRIVNNLKKFVLEIAKSIKKFTISEEEDLTLYFDDVIDHIDKVIETLEESRETMEIYKDTDFMLSTEKTNKVLAVLTIIFTLTIPATVIGTFYGMNVNLPGGNMSNLSSIESFVPFIIATLGAIIPAGLMFAYFRKLGWLAT